MDSVTQKYDLDRIVRIVITIVSVLACIYVINYLSSILLPFVVGCLLAYMLEPVVKFFRRLLHMESRFIAVLLTLVLVIGVLVLGCRLVIPYIVDEASTMATMLTEYAKSNIKVPYIPAEVHDFIRQYVDLDNIATMLSKEQWMKLANQLASGTWRVVGSTMNMLMTVVSWLIVLLYMFFVMLDYDKISRGFKAAIPKKYRKHALRIFNDVENTMSRYFRGQAMVSFFVGVIFAIEFYIIGLPMPIIFGLSIGVLNLVPYLQLISIPVAAFLCLVASVATGGSFWVLFGWTIAAYLICQVIQDMILIPTIMKSQMGLNPAIIFLALSIWAYVLGFIGLIIALPLTTLIISYYCEYVLHEPNPLRVRKKSSSSGVKKRVKTTETAEKQPE